MLISWWLCLHLIWCWKRKGKQINENLCKRVVLTLFFFVLYYFVHILIKNYSHTMWKQWEHNSRRKKMLFDCFLSLFVLLICWYKYSATSISQATSSIHSFIYPYVHTYTLEYGSERPLNCCEIYHPEKCLIHSPKSASVHFWFGIALEIWNAREKRLPILNILSINLPPSI